MNNNQYGIFRMMNLKDSNVYSILKLIYRYDSFGVEQGNEHLIFYKHTILSGLENMLFFN